MALATVRLWLELNYSSSGCFIFCPFENADYEIHKDLMPSVYFLALKHHLTNIYMKENALRKIYMKNTDFIVNVKSVEIINKLRQSSPGLQIYPNFAENIESEFLTRRSKRISSKVDF